MTDIWLYDDESREWYECCGRCGQRLVAYAGEAFARCPRCEPRCPTCGAPAEIVDAAHFTEAFGDWALQCYHPAPTEVGWCDECARFYELSSGDVL